MCSKMISMIVMPASWLTGIYLISLINLRRLLEGRMTSELQEGKKRVFHLFGRCTILVGFILPPNHLTGLQTPRPYSVSGASALRGMGWGSMGVTEASLQCSRKSWSYAGFLLCCRAWCSLSEAPCVVGVSSPFSSS